MSNETVVGVLSLDLIVKDTIMSQVQAISDKARTVAAKPFTEVGKKAGEAISNAVKVKIPEDEMKKSLDDAIERMLKREQAEMDAKGVSVPVTAEAMPSAAPTQQYDSAAIQQQIDDFAAKSNKAANVDMSRAFTAAQAPAELLGQKLANLREQMEQARRKSAEIDMSFDSIGEDGSAELDKVSAAAAQVEARIISLQQQLDATQAKIDAPMQKAAAAAAAAAAKTEAAAKKAEAVKIKAAEKAAAAEQRAANKAANAKIRAEQRAEKAAQAATARQRRRTTSVARAQAGSFLSAAASNAKGVAQVGIMGRAALTSLRGLATAVPFAALLAGFKLLKNAISMASDSNAQFKASLNGIKANLQVAFTPIYQAILPALNSLMAGLATAARYVATFVSAIFGKTYAQSLAATKSLQKTASAASAAKKSLSVAGFDELNILNKNDSNSASGTSDAGTDLSGISSQGDTAAEAFANKLKSLFAPFKSISFENLINSFDRLKTAIQPFGKQLTGGVEWFVEHILKPLSAWTIETALPSFLDTLSKALSFVGTIIETVKPGFEYLWEKVMKPIAEWTGGAIVEIWNQIGVAFDSVGQTIDGRGSDINAIFTAIGDTLSFVWTALLEPTFNELKEIVIGVFGGVVDFIRSSINNAVDTFRGIIDFITGVFSGDWEKAWSGITQFFTGIWGTIKAPFELLWSVIGNVATSVWDRIKGVWNSVGVWFNNNVISPIGNLFSNLWNGIKNGISSVKSFFRNAFNALVDIAKKPLNGIISLINGAISGVNSMIRGLNKLHIDLPDWLGGKSFGFNIGEIGRIPYLANGGIATQPTLAMIGEYSGAKSNPEVVAPLDKLQAMLGSSTDSRIIELLQTIIELLRKGQMIIVEGKVLMQLLQQEQDRQGRRFVTAGT